MQAIRSKPQRAGVLAVRRVAINAPVCSAQTATPVSPAPATVSGAFLTPETARVAAHAAMADDRKRGDQMAVAVVDRLGVLQVLVRDRLGTAVS